MTRSPAPSSRRGVLTARLARWTASSIGRSTGALLSMALVLPASAIHEGPPDAGDEWPPRDARSVIDWDRRAVEHVWNRAGFGISEAEIDAWVAAGPEALVDFLLAPRPLEGRSVAPPFVFEEPRIDPVEYEQRTIDQRREYRRIRSRVHREQFALFRESWVRRMLANEDPLRDRMTLFWHGVFTSSYETVRHPRPMVTQHHALRAGALGSYDALLRAMLRDPAMLVYLDNDENRKGKPNENLAREVMELFSLGEGSGYSESDVRGAARALTGAGVSARDIGGRYRFSPRHHDDGDKSILGQEGAFRPDDLASLLLARPECARFVAASIIEYLEGVTASEERVQRYAEYLRSTQYDVGFLLRKLLLDPAFYRDEVVGGRIASPVDYVVGVALRTGVEPPATFVVDAAAALGQDLFQPPNVKGWEEGLSWITTASFMLRGNIAGALLGRVDSKGLRADTAAFMSDLREEGAMGTMDDDSMEDMAREQMRRDELSRLTSTLKKSKYTPGISCVQALREALPGEDGEDGGERSDETIARVLAEQLLAVEPPDETVAMLALRLAELREARRLTESDLLVRPGRSEPVLRELGHLILSLPEAQIH